MKMSVLLALLVTSALSACAPQQPPSTKLRDAARITQDEVDASLENSAYDVIAKLRPTFLMSRGSTSLGAGGDSGLPWVFVDGIERGPISSLRSIAASTVAEIRLYRSWEATTRFGTGYMSGVIAIKTRR